MRRGRVGHPYDDVGAAVGLNLLFDHTGARADAPLGPGGPSAMGIGTIAPPGMFMPEVPPPPTFHHVDTAYRLHRATTSAVERDRLRRCILCRLGDRVMDAGGHGSGLHVQLSKLLENRVATMRPEELVDLIVNYVETKIRPAFRDVGRPCPLPEHIDVDLLYEHLTTSQHTLNSRLMLINMSRQMERILHGLVGYIFPTAGVPDPKMAETALKYFKEIRTFHMTPVSRLAFGVGAEGATDADDLAIDMTQTTLTSATTVLRIRQRQGPFVSRFLADYNRQAADAMDEVSADAADEIFEPDPDPDAPLPQPMDLPVF